MAPKKLSKVRERVQEEADEAEGSTLSGDAKFTGEIDEMVVDFAQKHRTDKGVHTPVVFIPGGIPWMILVDHIEQELDTLFSASQLKGRHRTLTSRLGFRDADFSFATSSESPAKKVCF